MKVSYLRNKDGSRFDVRAKVGDKLKHYNVTQGACCDGEHLYAAFEQKPKHGREHRIKIVKIDLKTLAILKVSAPLYLGHANDMCYADGFLYVTHSATKKVIHKVNATSFGKCKDISIEVPKKYKKYIVGFNGIEHNADGKEFIVRALGGNRVLYLDEKFKIKKIVTYTKPFTSKQREDSQGMTYKNDVVYRSYSKAQSKTKNYLCKFKPNGKLISKARVEVTGELENIFFYEGKLHGMVYRKKTKGKNQYMSYIFVAK